MHPPAPNTTPASPAERLISRFGVEWLARVCQRHVSGIRRWPVSVDKGGKGGLINARAQISIIEAAIAERTPFSLAEFFPCELVARLEASNASVRISEEEAA
jgi:hypothetical protein